MSRCDFCAFSCSLESGETGACGVRTNVDGTITTDVWGYVVSEAIDPVEKKPLYHFLPGSRTFSFALFGCNFRCTFCQNASIAYPEFRGTRAGKLVPPGEMVDRWVRSETPSIAFTYGEPAVWQDYLMEVATGVRARGGKTIMVSNGFYSETATERLAGVIDAFNIDLKGGSAFYRSQCKGARGPVVAAIRALAPRCHVEVTSMVIEGLHTEDEIAAIGADLQEAGVQVWHISRFFPAFQMSHRPATSERWLRTVLVSMRERLSIPFIYAGNSRQSEYHQTRCPRCATVCIERDTAAFVVDRTRDGACPGCGERLYGTFA